MVRAFVLIDVERGRLADLVTSGLLSIEGIARTETLPAFRAYSRHDLDAMFELGES